MQVKVWTEGLNRGLVHNLGSANLCLQALHQQAFEDKSYTDDRTKQKISFQCRVFTSTLKLQSSFYDTSNSSVTLSIWFQPELPYPAVDLSRLQPNEGDVYPKGEIEQKIKKGVYDDRFRQVLSRNFPPEYPTDSRRFNHLIISDQYRGKHLLPLYLSKITPPDSNIISQDQERLVMRGIRTLSEVAHFVRCIPFKDHLYQSDNVRVWASPDFLLNMRSGSQEEHTILMASMFRAVKFEDAQELSEIIEDGFTKHRTSKKTKKHPDSNPISERVFVCLGKARDTGQDHAWVLTFDKTFEEVSFWDVSSGTPRNFALPGRIQQGESNYLQGYLCPNLSEEEKEDVQKLRELKRQESSWFQQSEHHQSEMAFDGDDPHPANHQGSVVSGNGVTDDDKESDDSDFLDKINRLVQFEDLDQRHKGVHNINFVGKIAGQSREKQDHLKELDYLSDEDEIDPMRQGHAMLGRHQKLKKANKFLEQQDKERKAREEQRLDKHLLPVESFFDHKTGRTVPAGTLPYSQIDLIFNHRNVWANLQNQSPACIYYHLHDEKQWLPLITDPLVPHALLERDRPPVEISEEEITKNKNKKKVQGNEMKLMECRMRGDYMKSFSPFYDPRGMEAPMNAQQVQRLEGIITKDVQIAIKQVRSAKNLKTKIRNNQVATNVLRLQLDFLEDRDCDRIKPEDLPETKQQLQRELLKLVPENYRISILPTFFNYYDAERIKTVISDQAKDFILGAGRISEGKVMFTVGVKIFPFHNHVSSVRLVVAKMTSIPAKPVNPVPVQVTVQSGEALPQKKKVVTNK